MLLVEAFFIKLSSYRLIVNLKRTTKHSRFSLSIIDEAVFLVEIETYFTYIFDLSMSTGITIVVVNKQIFTI